MGVAFEAIMRRAVFGAVLAFWAAPAVAQEPARELVVDLSVNVDPVKLNGSPWDGLPAIGGRILFPDENNAPDIAVCVVLASGAPECVWRADGRRRFSHCPNADKCTIPGMRIPSLPVGLIFLDVDRFGHDLMDFVILTGGAADTGEIEKIEANLHSAMADLTPGNTAADRQRRQRKATVLPIEQCTGANARCDLTQSRFQLEKR
jgi:hypothetical protein